MRGEEFRIGNILSGNRIVKKLHETYYTDTKGESTLFRDAQPMMLTEEWQLKFGKHDDYYKGIVIEIKLLSGREARLIFQKSGYVILHDGRKNIVIGKIPFVHQLQNLYYALSGKELISK